MRWQLGELSYALTTTHGELATTATLSKGANAKNAATAPFPPELARSVIDRYTIEGDLVRDPFGGTGATMVASMKVQPQRRCVIYELKADFTAHLEQDTQISGGGLTEPFARHGYDSWNHS